MSPRSSQRVDRRRRVLVDESRNEEYPCATPRIFRDDSDAVPCRYNSQALQSLNAPIARYIPLRTYSMVLWFLVGLVPILGLLLLNEWRDRIARGIGYEATRAFELTGPGNLVAWLSSITFGFAGAVMLGIYSVRRHRRDDYRGRFTVWRWAIAAAILASIDSTAGLHYAWQAGCQKFTQSPLWGDGSIWWIGLWATVFGGTMIRLMFEMASSRHAVAWTMVAGVCYLWCGLVELSTLPTGREAWLESSKVAALMMGHHVLLFALVGYARHIVLEAMGTVQASVKQKKAEPTQNTQAVARSDNEAGNPKLQTVASTAVAASAIPKPTRGNPNSEQPKPKVIDLQDNREEDVQARQRSKAERRRLRKEKRSKAA